MGLWKIDNVSRTEWERRARRQHEIHMWLLLVGQLILIGVVIAMIIWICGEFHP